MNVALDEPQTIADLLKQLGGISPSRVRLHPTPGTAQEQDVIAAHNRDKRLFELVDGVLVEKVMGFYESYLAATIGFFLQSFLRQKKLGIVVGADGMHKLAPGLVRIPDVSFVSWDRLPNRRVPRQPIPDLAPNLAVEVLSKGNTRAEMKRKLHDYFTYGVQLVWYVDPRTCTARVYVSPDQCTEIPETGVLDGGGVLPGFSLSLKDLFAPPVDPENPGQAATKRP